MTNLSENAWGPRLPDAGIWKDIYLKEEFTFQLQECAVGDGTLDAELFAQLATRENPDMPMIIEHLTTDEEYINSFKYVKGRLNA